jgi:hypothetical protein
MDDTLPAAEHQENLTKIYMHLQNQLKLAYKLPQRKCKLSLHSNIEVMLWIKKGLNLKKFKLGKKKSKYFKLFSKIIG